MVARAYVLITADAGRERDIYDKIKSSKEFKEIYMVFGEHDIIAKIEAEDTDGLGKLVLDEVRTIDGILSTLTLTVADIGLRYRQ